jgi:hypothetical protein
VIAVLVEMKVVRLVRLEREDVSPVALVLFKYKEVRFVKVLSPAISPVIDVPAIFKDVRLGKLAAMFPKLPDMNGV